MSQDRYPFVLRMTRVCLGTFLLLVAAANVPAQSKKDILFQVPTAESHFLDLIDLEEDPGKQLLLIELFMKNNPNYGGMSALWALVQSDSVQVGKFDQALEFGAKLLKLDPADVEAIKLNIQAAEGKKDAALTKFWKDRLDELTKQPDESITATSQINLPFVEGPDAPPDAALSPAMRNARARREALAFNDLLQVRNPASRLEMLAKFPQLYPHSQHLQKIQYLKFLTFQDLKDDSSALQIAEDILRRDRTREDVVFFAAARYYSEKRNLPQVIEYSKLMLDLVNKKPRPDELSEAEWEKQKRTIRLQAHFMTGSIHLEAGRWQAADAALREALPLAGGETRLSMLNSLAFVNYKMRRPTEAIKFYEIYSSIPGPHQETARQAIASIKSEYELQ